MKEHHLDEKVLGKSTAVDKQSHSERSVRDLVHSFWENPESSADAGPRVSDSLTATSHRIKLLNNELHKPGGPLANSDLELVGFDKRSRLLMVHRDEQTGKVDGKFLVDSESGKVVARTRPGDLGHWDKAKSYDSSGVMRENLPDGASVDKRSYHGHWQPIHMVDAYGNMHIINRDDGGAPTEISFVNQDGSSERYKPKATVPGITGDANLWVKQPEVKGVQAPTFGFQVNADGSLVRFSKKDEYVTYGTDGSIVSHSPSQDTTLRPAARDL